MLDDTLPHFITESSQQGRSEEVIRELLLQNGWTPDKIDEAFAFLKNSQPVPTSTTAQPRSPGMPQSSSPFNFFSYQGRIGRLKYFLGWLVIGAIVGVCIFIFDALVFASFLHFGQQPTAVYS
jgi:hypothetical protein